MNGDAPARSGPERFVLSEDANAQIRDALSQGKTSVVLKPKGPGGCSLVVVFGPNGEIKSFGCTGGCGFVDRLLGRSCGKASPGTDDGGVELFCACMGGWFDSIFSR